MQDPTATGLADDSFPRRLALQFTGSGSEYFRIWLVNLVLTVVTLTLYAPFAKVRRLRWQYANTLVDGLPLAFHGDPWKMLRGHLVMLVLAGLYVGAGKLSATAGGVAALLFAGAWPALWWLSLRFRLANTSWRGVRMAFTGTLGGAYRALAPILLPMALLLGGLVQPEDGPPVSAVLVGLAPALVGVMWPWVAFRAKRYQHNHYHWAGQTTRFASSAGAFYGVSLRAGLVTGGLVLAAVALGLGLGLALGWAMGGNGPEGDGLGGTLLLAVPLAMGYLVAVVVGQAYLVARMQNLVWCGTSAPALRFHSALAWSGLWRLMARNLLLTAVTLGLYWPFAWVAMTAMRLQAMAVDVDENPATWVAGAAGPAGGAIGDAAGDLLDVDIGL